MNTENTITQKLRSAGTSENPGSPEVGPLNPELGIPARHTTPDNNQLSRSDTGGGKEKRSVAHILLNMGLSVPSSLCGSKDRLRSSAESWS